MNKLILALICLLASCQSYRAERKINKLKQWGYLSDSTITKYDTIRGWSLDSVYIFDTLSKVDTISIVKNGIKSVTVINKNLLFAYNFSFYLYIYVHIYIYIHIYIHIN